MARVLGQFVLAESSSFDKAAVDRFGRILAAEWKRRGATVTLLPQKRRGDHIRAELGPGGKRASGQILVLGHLDTVYATGTIAQMPFRVSQGRAWGPGVFDMKSGLVISLYAMDALAAAGFVPQKRIVFLWTSDEEIGSETSRAVIEREARRSDAVLVLEPALGPTGLVKTGRKGVGEFDISATGRAAHAGLNPEDGINAIDENSASGRAHTEMESAPRRNHRECRRNRRRNALERSPRTRANSDRCAGVTARGYARARTKISRAAPHPERRNSAGRGRFQPSSHGTKVERFAFRQSARSLKRNGHHAGRGLRWRCIRRKFHCCTRCTHARRPRRHRRRRAQPARKRCPAFVARARCIARGIAGQNNLVSSFCTIRVSFSGALPVHVGSGNPLRLMAVPATFDANRTLRNKDSLSDPPSRSNHEE